MKKTLTALAVLGAFAGSAMAADVTVYGKVDAGLNWANTKLDTTAVGSVKGFNYSVDSVDEDIFAMKTGQNSANRFGIKGTEDLGNGMTVGFVLENGFNADDGSLKSAGKLFDRQANLFIKGGFGELSFGRVGALSSGAGSYSTVWNHAAFGTGWGEYVGSKGLFGLDRSRYDNMVTYVSPEFAGAKVYAQYSLQQSGAEKADTGANDRYAALGAGYKLGAFSADLVVDSVMPSNLNETKTENSLGVSLGASYDFGFMKLMGLAQYGKNESKIAGFTAGDVAGLHQVGKNGNQKFVTTAGNNEGMKGYGLQLSVIAPIAGGKLFAAVNYADGENDGVNSFNWATDVKDPVVQSGFTTAADTDAKAYGFAVGYEYPLSTRTKVYGFATYDKTKYENTYTWAKTPSTNALTATSELETDITEVGFGLVHSF